MDPSITSYIAIYGAVLATITLLWNIRMALRDRGALELNAEFRKVVHNAYGEPTRIDPPDNLTKTYLYIIVSNTGRRPITFTALQGRQGGSFHRSAVFKLDVPRLPITLGESENHEVQLEPGKVFKGGLRQFFAIDSHGRKWALRRRRLWGLRRAYTRLAQASPQNVVADGGKSGRIVSGADLHRK